MLEFSTDTLACSITSLIFGLILLSISSFGLLAALRMGSLVSNLLGFTIIAYGTIVLLAQILSELNLLNWCAFLVGHAVLAVLTLPLTLRFGPDLLQTFHDHIASIKTYFKTICSENLDLAILGASVSITTVLGAFLILKVPPNTTDSLEYHLSRVAYWLNHQNMHHFYIPNEVKLINPVNSEIGLFWLTALWGTDLLTGFLQWMVAILTIIVIYGIARQLEYSSAASLFAALIWSTFTIVVAQSTSTKNDIVVTYWIMVTVYFLLVGLQQPQHNVSLMLAGLAFGLAAGTKSLSFLALVGLGVMAGWLTLHRPRQFFYKFAYWAVWSIVGFIFLGAYNYILNWLDFGSFMGPPEIVGFNTIQNPSLASLATNLTRVGYLLVDPTGLPAPVIDFIQQWRPQIGAFLASALGVDPNMPGTSWGNATFNFADGRYFVSRDGLSWYGPLVILLLLPSIVHQLVISPFINPHRWRWFIALASVCYLVALALLIRWQPYMGRYLMVGITLGAPLMAGFYEYFRARAVVRWIVIAIAIWVLAWSATHNFHRPLLGPVDIQALDYYDMRTLERPYMAQAYRYLDANVPPTTRLGVAGDWLLVSWDYLLFGPELKRRVSHLDPDQLDRIDPDTFLENKIDYLLLSASAANAAESQTPLWPVTRVRVEWHLASRAEAELFSKGDPDLFAESYGQEYEAYTQIETALQQESAPIKVLTTDPRMPYYVQDSPFDFDIPQDLGDLQGYSHLVIAPLWSTEDFARLGLSEVSQSELQNFLTQPQFVEKILETNNYELYRILF